MAAAARIAILGAAGRMGEALRRAARADDAVTVSALVERVGHPDLGRALDEGGPVMTTDLATADFEVAIDFTRPEATLEAIATCRRLGRPMVIGTTGLTREQAAALDAAAHDIPLCVAANFSIGVNVVLDLLARAGRLLGPDYDVEITEAHHRHKVDAPSGTALRMGEEVAKARGTTLAESALHAREGQVGPRPAGAIGFSVLRGGDVVGDHVVSFLGDGERIEVAHRATDRGNFARGALRAAAWLKGRKPGRYTIGDVLGL